MWLVTRLPWLFTSDKKQSERWRDLESFIIEGTLGSFSVGQYSGGGLALFLFLTEIMSSYLHPNAGGISSSVKAQLS